ncbi:hypothetical protein ACFWYW_34770 [Nonomuraea sp. NPDC059023]|uniref:hypothetical protein n=1 Tax=unclassified Nonomuraea TaxID=2593643 RepID=UPI0036BE7545
MKTTIALAALVLSLAACGNTAPEKNTTVNSGDQRLKTAECLRAKGVKVGDPGGLGKSQTIDSGGMDQKEFEKLLKECGAFGGTGKQISQADKDKALAFAKCMREQGLDFPDPEFDGGMQEARPVPADKAAFEKANKTCSEKTG